LLKSESKKQKVEKEFTAGKALEEGKLFLFLGMTPF